MIVGLVLLGALVAGVVFGVRRLGRSGGVAGGSAVRRFFQYLLLYGLLVVVAIGLSGLVARLLGGTEIARFDEAQLARSLTFILVGGPLYGGVAVWSRRRMAADATETRSVGWALYATLASLTALVTAMFAFHDVLDWALGVEDYDGEALASLIVWGAVWAAHWIVDTRVTPQGHSQVHHLLGSLIGLGTSFVGLSSLLGSALESLFGLYGDVLAAGESALLRSAATLLVGAPVWVTYWSRTAARREKTALWLVYVLLFGVGGSLVAALTAAGGLVYDVLVWTIGDPRADDASRHFDDVPTLVAVLLVGALVWWYHRSVLEDRPGARSEVRRVYEYLMAGVGLLAAAGGVITVLVAFLEAIAGTGGVLVQTSAVNTLLGAVTFLVVGAPVWWVFWRRIQRAEPAEERAAPTRRIYLFLLFGVGGVAAVIALITAVFILLEDVFEGTVGSETARSARFAVGVLIATGAIAAYHWAVYRTDREHAPDRERGPRYVLLIGAPDDQIVGSIAHRTGGRVQAWPRTDGAGGPWSVEDVMTALGTVDEEEVVVLSDGAGLRIIPVDRR